MDIDFWHDRWRNGETGFHQAHFNPWLEYYYGAVGPPLANRSNYRVFVPLCGKSRDLWWLSENGYDTIGVECSEIAVQDFFKEHELEFVKTPQDGHVLYRAPHLDLLLGDFFDLEPATLGRVTDVFDRASLIALPPDMRRTYAEKMKTLLSPGTRVLLITLAYPQHEMEGPPFSVDDDELDSLYADSFKIDKLAAKNVLDDEPRFKSRGLTQLTETAWKLTRSETL